jgi:hypothetical protein
MKMHRLAFGLGLCLVAAAAVGATFLYVSHLGAAEALRSGPQVGATIPGPFEPLNVTGDSAGKEHCLVCENSGNPVAMVFARDVSPTLTALLKKIDAETAKNKNASMGSFVVFLSDDKGLPDKLKKVAKDEGFKNIVLAVYAPDGPEKYKVAKDADVTVVLYDADSKVQANYAFKKGELKDKDVDAIVSDVPKIFAKK